MSNPIHLLHVPPPIIHSCPLHRTDPWPPLISRTSFNCATPRPRSSLDSASSTGLHGGMAWSVAPPYRLVVKSTIPELPPHSHCHHSLPPPSAFSVHAAPVVPKLFAGIIPSSRRESHPPALLHYHRQVVPDQLPLLSPPTREALCAPIKSATAVSLPRSGMRNCNLQSLLRCILTHRSTALSTTAACHESPNT
mmetsp:Transcript_1899/g.3577  ORF Transcript_1899/g.3577 Transcript_1899/m.3577 type:complete len:194 (-) Transcript_1899:133-714(-)